jgi:mevalonate kinase
MEAPRHFFARGKLLITGEYGVVHGARALAVPTRLGQHLHFTPSAEALTWTAYDVHGQAWLDGPVAQEESLALVRGCIEAALTLKGKTTWPTGHVVTRLEFERHWGWGSSSTLIALIAQWLDVDPLALHFQVSKGSGYDVACATAEGPLYYERTDNYARVTPADLCAWPVDELYLVYLGQKKDSQTAVAHYLQNPMGSDALETLSAFSTQFASATTAEALAQACLAHEAFLAPHLGIPSPVASLCQNAYAGGKSLGAWGGDFALMVSPQPNALEYLQSHDLGPVFSWKEVCLG